MFFDLRLPYSPRRVVSLVGYLVWKTLGWCDDDGNPQDEEIYCSYRDLIEHAGISREMVNGYVDEALDSHFIESVSCGKAAMAGTLGAAALYRLHRHAGTEYVKDRHQFHGFFVGEGNSFSTD